MAAQVLSRYAAPPAAECLRRNVGISVRSQKDQFDCWAYLVDLAASVKSVQDRHREIDNDDMGLLLDGSSHHRASVADNTDNVKLNFQKFRAQLSDQGMVVGDKDARP